MQRFFCFAFLVFLSFQSVRAQHCPFDGASLIVASVRGSDSSSFSTYYLSLSIRDSRGNIVYAGGKPLIFVKNPTRTWAQRDTYDHDQIAYQFAGNNFILHFPDYLLKEYANKGGLYIYANPTTGYYLPVIYPLKETDVYNIHYVNNYVSFRSTNTDPVPENENDPFNHLVRLVVPVKK